jgi:hypothetical protein
MSWEHAISSHSNLHPVREMVQEAELGGWAMSPPLSESTNAVQYISAFATLTLGKEVVEGRGGIWARLII